MTKFEIKNIKDLGNNGKANQYLIELNQEFPCGLLQVTNYVIMSITDLGIGYQKADLGRIEIMFFPAWKNGEVIDYKDIHVDRDVTQEKAISGFLEVMNYSL
jgi:hypothetical protein